MNVLCRCTTIGNPKFTHQEKKQAFFLMIFNKRGILLVTLRALSPALLRLATAGKGEQLPPMAGAQCPRRLFGSMEVSSLDSFFYKMLKYLFYTIIKTHTLEAMKTYRIVWP